jgi:hypothetical protein
LKPVDFTIQTFDPSVAKMKRNWYSSFRRNYGLETKTAAVIVAVLTLAWIGLRRTDVVSDQMKIAFSVLSAAFIFFISTIYGRTKDRREAKRTRALSLFAEWHSADIRESRIFVSHYRSIIAKGSSDNLPSLSNAEKNAGEVRRTKTASEIKDLTSLTDATQIEFHFFKVYQFFERWTLLLENNDIDPDDSRIYLSSYGQWYLDNFIKPWHRKEASGDPFIFNSLTRIVDALDQKPLAQGGWMRRNFVRRVPPE